MPEPGLKSTQSNGLGWKRNDGPSRLGQRLHLEFKISNTGAQIRQKRALSLNRSTAVTLVSYGILVRSLYNGQVWDSLILENGSGNPADVKSAK